MYRGSFFPGRGTLVEESQKIGEARARAADVLRILERRGVAVPEVHRQRVLECDDLGVLDDWFDRAITAEAADEVFGEPQQ
ncbi:hypothetical protein [Streptodolium elevatio]